MKYLLAVVLALAMAAFLPGCGSGDSFTVLTYNIHHGRGLDGKVDIPRIGRVINAHSPHFACLQEVDMNTERTGGADTCAILSEETGMHATFAKAIPLGSGEYGIAVLSREKPLSTKRVALPGSESRVLLICEFDDCVIANTHLDLKHEARMKAVEIIKSELSAYARKPVFLAGDWNSGPGSPELSAIGGFASVISARDRATYHKPHFTQTDYANAKLCIDYIAVDTAHRAKYDVVKTYVVEERVASDHVPVVVTVSPVVQEPAGGK